MDGQGACGYGLGYACAGSFDGEVEGTSRTGELDEAGGLEGAPERLSCEHFESVVGSDRLDRRLCVSYE